ncbi:metallophosphoesterase [archaeon]|nr:metallophosphoesterase [archaeon]
MTVVLAVSDTHDRVENIQVFTTIAKQLNPTAIFHAGDYVSPFTAEPFRTIGPKLFGVWGNNDGDKPALKRKFSEIGARIGGFVLITTIAGRRIFITHHLENDVLIDLANRGAFDLIIIGHTHRARVEKVGKTLVVNPGTLAGYVSGETTYAVIDLDRLDASVETLSGS